MLLVRGCSQHGSHPKGLGHGVKAGDLFLSLKIGFGIEAVPLLGCSILFSEEILFEIKYQKITTSNEIKKVL